MACSIVAPHGYTRMPAAQATSIVGGLIADHEKITTLRSFARLMLISKGHAYRASVAVLLERPDRFRIEFLGPFRHPRHIVAFDGGLFSEIGKNNAIRLQDAHASGATLSFLGLTPEWVVAAVLGLPPISRDSVLVEQAFHEGKNKVRIELKDKTANVTFWVKLRDGQADVERFAFVSREGRQPVIEGIYSGFRDVIGQDKTRCRLPRIVILRVPERHQLLRMTFSSPDVNARLDPASFRIRSRIGS